MSQSSGNQPVTRRRTITHPEPSPHLASLTLAELRAYRARLNCEEERASYWRRLVHARIDLLEAESSAEGELGLEDLVRVLGETGSGQTRRALLRVQAADPLPELPELARIWTADVDPQDEQAVADALARLNEAEAQLTHYRRALFDRIDQATSELIVRYREHPPSALAALPED